MADKISYGAFHKRKKTIPRKIVGVFVALCGGIVGLVTGVLGGGGGSLVVPLYESSGVERKRAHATAIATILPLTIISGAIYLSRGYYPYAQGIWVSIGVIIGGMIGTVCLKKINPTLLSLIFYSIMIYAGLKMLR